MTTYEGSLSSRIKMKRHLQLLSLLSFTEILEVDLVQGKSLNVFQKWASSRFPEHLETMNIKIPIQDQGSVRLDSFSKSLYYADDSPVAIFIETSTICGALIVSSIRDFNFRFSPMEFSDSTIGILGINGVNRMLIDVEADALEFEIVGERWRKVSY
jgi:hypothetical protein